MLKFSDKMLAWAGSAVGTRESRINSKITLIEDEIIRLSSRITKEKSKKFSLSSPETRLKTIKSLQTELNDLKGEKDSFKKELEAIFNAKEEKRKKREAAISKRLQKIGIYYGGAEEEKEEPEPLEETFQETRENQEEIQETLSNYGITQDSVKSISKTNEIIAESLKKISEQMVDEQDTSIKRKDKPTPVSTVTINEKEEKQEDESGGILDALLSLFGGAALWAAIKAAGGFVKWLGKKVFEFIKESPIIKWIGSKLSKLLSFMGIKSALSGAEEVLDPCSCGTNRKQNKRDKRSKSKNKSKSGKQYRDFTPEPESKPSKGSPKKPVQGAKPSSSKIGSAIKGLGVKFSAPAVKAAARFAPMLAGAGVVASSALAPILAVAGLAYTAYEGFQGWKNASEIAGLAPGQQATFGQKLGAGASSVLSTLSFGTVSANSIYSFGSNAATAVSDLYERGKQIVGVESAGTSDVKAAISTAAEKTGVPVDYLNAIAKVESNFNPNARSKTSSAKGLFQFLDSTWSSMMRNNAAAYGLTGNESQFDPLASSIMGALYIRDNMKYLQKVIGRTPSVIDIYMAHFMGAGGAAKFLSAMDKNPGAIAASLFPKEAASNMPVFYKNGKALTLGEIYFNFGDKLGRKTSRMALKGEKVISKTPTAKVTASEGSVPQISEAIARIEASAPQSSLAVRLTADARIAKGADVTAMSGTENIDIKKVVKPADSSVDIDGLKPGVKKNLAGMASEYMKSTGKPLVVNSAHRSIEKQKVLYEQAVKKYGPDKASKWAARPGSSLHNFGLAVDINSLDANKLDSMGLLSKYGFHRPLSNEAWHVEPKGINRKETAKEAVKVANASSPAIPEKKGSAGKVLSESPQPKNKPEGELETALKTESVKKSAEATSTALKEISKTAEKVETNRVAEAVKQNLSAEKQTTETPMTPQSGGLLAHKQDVIGLFGENHLRDTVTKMYRGIA